jgi:hypothetical protein
MEGKIEGKAPEEPRHKYLGQIKKDMRKKSHREVKEIRIAHMETYGKTNDI